MNFKFKVYLCTWFFYQNLIIFASALPTKLNDHQPIESLSSIHMALDQVSQSDLFTFNIFQTIDKVFGAQGIGMDSYQIESLKKVYLYLIFLTKLEKVAKDPKFAAYKSDFLEFLQDNGTAMPHLPTAQLLNSQGWLSVVITAQDIVNSTAWQQYCKVMITDIYVYYVMVLQIIHNVEKQTFNYIPHFETSFYNQDYTNLRNLNEMSRTRLQLEEILKNRWVAQTVNWVNLPTVGTVEKVKGKAVSTPTLEMAIIEFKHSQFYNLIRHTKTSASTLLSPLKEQVFCYYLLYEVSGQMTSLIDHENLAQILQVVGDSGLIPNIFPYRSDDYVLFDEILSIKSKTEGTHVQSIHPSAKQFTPEQIRKPEFLTSTGRDYASDVQKKLDDLKNNQVEAQSFLSFFRHIGDDIKHGFEDIGHAVVSAFHAVEKFTIAAGQGIAGIGAELVGQTSFAHREFEDTQKNFNSAIHSLNNSVDNFGKSLVDGIAAPFNQVNGELVGFILDDQKLGQDISNELTSVAGVVANVAEQGFNFYTDIQLDVGADLFQAAAIASELAVVIADAAWAIFSKKGREEFLKEGSALGHQCVVAVAQAYTIIKGATMQAVKSVMVGLGVIISAITTIFIDLSREVTFLFTGGILALGPLQYIPGDQQATAYAIQARDHVTSVLDAHRATINTVMGVVACVAADAVVDIGSGGTATAADAEIDIAIMGAEQGATEASEEAAQTAETLMAESDQAEVAAQSSKNLVQKLSEKLSTLSDQPDASEELINATKQDLQDAQEQLVANTKKADEALQLAQQAALKAKEVAPEAKQATQEVVEKTFAQNVKEFGENNVQTIKNKAQKLLDQIKSLPENVSKYAKNIVTSNQELAEIAAKNVTEKEAEQVSAQTAFDAAKQDALTANDAVTKAIADGDQDAIDAAKNEAKNAIEQLKTAGQDLKSANADLKEAQDAATNAEKIANETKSQKVKRLGKAVVDVLHPGDLLNVVFNMGSMISGANQDAKNALDLQNQAESLKKLWAFSNENKLSMVQQQFAFVDEMQEKVQAQIGNQALSLTLSQNTINSEILSLRTGIAKVLAPLYVQQLVPNPTTNLAAGNVGTSWNLKSGYVNVYPSQGFYSTTTGRSDFPFAQEIAQAPATSNLLITGTSNKPQNLQKFWFNQRCTARDDFSDAGMVKKPDDALAVQINMQFLYTLNSSFHVGIYLGGNYHDYNSPTYLAPYLISPVTISSVYNLVYPPTAMSPTLQQSQVNPSLVDLDEAHLAKMVVLYRDSKNSPLMLGLYEHEGLGWIIKEPLPTEAQLDQSHMYTVQSVLHQSALNIKLFVDGNSNAIFEKTVKVTPILNQRTYGIICEGAAIEWKQLLPKLKIDTKLRTESKNIESEIDREKKNKVLLAQALSPKFGSYALKPLSRHAVLLGQYVYGTTDTDLKNILPDSPIDFVIFGINQFGSQTFGLDPNIVFQNQKSVLISLINGTMYNASGQVVGNVANVWEQYQNSGVGTFSPKLNDFIKSQQKTLNEALAKVTFGNFSLDIINDVALSAGQYLYTCTQTLKDATGKPITDYLACVNIVNNALTDGTIGIAPTASNANGLLSFVSGNLYLKSAEISKKGGPTPIGHHNQWQRFGTYCGQFNIASSPPNSIYTLVVNAASNYVPPVQQPKTPKIEIKPIVIKKPTYPGIHFVFGGQKPKPEYPGIHFSFGSTKNLDDRQKAAAGNVSYQLGNQKSVKS